MSKITTIEDIKTRLYEKYGDLVTLADNQIYTKMINPIIFVDKDFGEWETSPNNVLNKGCTHPQRKLQKRKETTLKLYGVDNVFKSQKIKEKTKQKLIEKYGSDHPMRVEEIKQKTQETCLERYNAKNPLKSPEILEKIKATMLDRYGVDNSFKSSGVRTKIKNTWLENYGVDNPKKNEVVVEKTKQTCVEKYGGIAPACSKNVQDKTIKTNLERYGGIAPLCNKEVHDKLKQTNLTRYGVENPFANKEIQEKIAKIIIKKYGIDRTEDSKELKKRIYILPNGTPLINYLKQYDKLSHYTSCIKIYKKHGFDVLKEYVEGDKEFLQTSTLEEITQNLLGITRCKETVGKRKPDFKLTDSIFLEVDGLYWHSSLVKDKWYHFKKRIEYEQYNYRLLQFRSNEIEQKPEIVVSIINNALNNNTKIYARKCIIKSIKWLNAKNFLQQNHLQGCGSPATSYGLFYNDTLLMVICLKKRKNIGIEVSRLCTANGFIVIGGFNKFLSFIKRIHEPNLLFSWCDLRYANGHGYEKVGFKCIKDTLSWSWTDFQNTYHRLSCRANLDERKLSEAEYAKELNLVRIYDAGQRLYIKTF